MMILYLRHLRWKQPTLNLHLVGGTTRVREVMLLARRAFLDTRVTWSELLEMMSYQPLTSRLQSQKPSTKNMWHKELKK